MNLKVNVKLCGIKEGEGENSRTLIENSGKCQGRKNENGAVQTELSKEDDGLRAMSPRQTLQNHKIIRKTRNATRQLAPDKNAEITYHKV